MAKIVPIFPEVAVGSALEKAVTPGGLNAAMGESKEGVSLSGDFFGCSERYPRADGLNLQIALALRHRSQASCEGRFGHRNFCEWHLSHAARLRMTRLMSPNAQQGQYDVVTNVYLDLPPGSKRGSCDSGDCG